MNQRRQGTSGSFWKNPAGLFERKYMVWLTRTPRSYLEGTSGIIEGITVRCLKGRLTHVEINKTNKMPLPLHLNDFFWAMPIGVEWVEPKYFCFLGIWISTTGRFCLSKKRGRRKKIKEGGRAPRECISNALLDGTRQQPDDSSCDARNTQHWDAFYHHGVGRCYHCGVLRVTSNLMYSVLST